MPRYFFDIRDAEQRTRDDEGVELANLNDVRRVAARTLAELGLEEFPASSERRLGATVRDSKDRTVLTTELTFKALTPTVRYVCFPPIPAMTDFDPNRTLAQRRRAPVVGRRSHRSFCRGAAIARRPSLRVTSCRPVPAEACFRRDGDTSLSCRFPRPPAERLTAGKRSFPWRVPRPRRVSSDGLRS